MRGKWTCPALSTDLIRGNGRHSFLHPGHLFGLSVVSGIFRLTLSTLDVVGNGVTEDGDGIINGQKVVDLKSVNQIYEKGAGCETIVQAEAATMCGVRG